jgi:hypothetical protein
MDPRVKHLESQIDRIQLDQPPVAPHQEPAVPNPAPADIIVDHLWLHYREHVPNRPLWHLVEDMQQQAMVYANIIEQLKWGREASHIKARIQQELDLVPPGTLPNPIGSALLTRASRKVKRYTTALLDIVKRHGKDLLHDDLEFARDLTPSVSVEIGIPPALSLGVEISSGRD